MNFFKAHKRFDKDWTSTFKNQFLTTCIEISDLWSHITSEEDDKDRNKQEEK